MKKRKFPKPGHIVVDVPGFGKHPGIVLATKRGDNGLQKSKIAMLSRKKTKGSIKLEERWIQHGPYSTRTSAKGFDANQKVFVTTKIGTVSTPVFIFGRVFRGALKAILFKLLRNKKSKGQL